MSKMPKYEKLRSRRRIPTLLEEPPNRIIAILNSAFFIWLVSAVFVTVGGSYFSGIQKCTADAEGIIDRYDLLESEYYSREYYYYGAVLSANTIEDLAKSKGEYKSSYSEFQTKDYHEIQREIDSILHRIPPMSKDDLKIAREQYPYFVNESLAQYLISYADELKMPYALDRMKKAVKDKVRSVDKPLFVLRSNCSPRAVFGQLFYGERDVVRGTLALPNFQVNPDGQKEESTLAKDPK